MKERDNGTKQIHREVRLVSNVLSSRKNIKSCFPVVPDLFVTRLNLPLLPTRAVIQQENRILQVIFIISVCTFP